MEFTKEQLDFIRQDIPKCKDTSSGIVVHNIDVNGNCKDCNFKINKPT